MAMAIAHFIFMLLLMISFVTGTALVIIGAFVFTYAFIDRFRRKR